MWDTLGVIALLIIVVGIYIYYGSKVFNFIRQQIFIRQSIKRQQVKQVVDSMTEEDWKNYGTWMKKKIEQESEDKKNGKFRF
jgi:hypothetical protein